MKVAEILKGYEGKIVVVKGTEKKDGTVLISRWKNEREKYLYNGKITTQNLREKIEKTKDYSLCDGCGQRIGIKRLTAMPYVKYCVDCQEKTEN